MRQVVQSELRDACAAGDIANNLPEHLRGHSACPNPAHLVDRSKDRAFRDATGFLPFVDCGLHHAGTRTVRMCPAFPIKSAPGLSTPESATSKANRWTPAGSDCRCCVLLLLQIDQVPQNDGGCFGRSQLTSSTASCWREARFSITRCRRERNATTPQVVVVPNSAPFERGLSAHGGWYDFTTQPGEMRKQVATPPQGTRSQHESPRSVCSDIVT